MKTSVPKKGVKRKKYVDEDEEVVGSGTEVTNDDGAGAGAGPGPGPGPGVLAIRVKPQCFRFPSHIEHPALLQKACRRRAPVARKFKKCSRQPVTAARYSAVVDLRRTLLSLSLTNVEADSTDSADGHRHHDYDDDYDDDDDDERKFVRYHNFIRHGVDIVNVAPIDHSCTVAILSRLPATLANRYGSIVEAQLHQVREEFFYSVKKSIIDFTVQSNALSDENNWKVAFARASTSHLRTKRNLFDRTRNVIERSLYKIHPAIVKVNQLWTIRYSDLRIANVKDLYTLEALELNFLMEWFGSQIQLYESVINNKWIPSVFKIVSDAIDRRHLDDTKESDVNNFYKSLATLMTLQLQQLCCATIHEYTDFVCDVDRNAAFQVHVLYQSNKIIFAPSYREFCNALCSVYGKLLDAVSRVPRIETKLTAGRCTDDQPSFLKPSILAETIESCRSRIVETLQNEWICPELRIQDFDEYINLINGQSRIEVNKFLTREHNLRAIEQKVSYYRDLADEILVSCDRVVTMGSFEIHRQHFVTILANKAHAIRDRFLEKISDTYQRACKCLNEEFQSIKDTLLRPPSNTVELVRKKEYSLNLGTKVLFEMEQRLRETMDKILFCSDFVPLTSAQIKRNSSTFLCYKRINAVLEENQNIVAEKTKEFQELLLNRAKAFESDLERYRRETNEFQNYRDAGELSKYLRKAQNLSKILVAAEQRIRQFNEEEEAFGWTKSTYPHRDRLVEKLTPYKKLYENCANYKSKYETWTEAKIGAFEPHEIEADVETFRRNIVELSQQFGAIPAPYALTNSIRSEVEQFQKNMPIVKTLGNPCLKDRHWEKISEIVGFPMRVTDDLTLAKILDYGLEEYVAKFEAISDSATKENDLETRLNAMMAEWKDMRFELSARSGTYVLASTDDIQMLLDDHIVKTQTMKNSPYIEPFEKRMRSWQEKLIFVQEMMDAWLSVQKGWLYLEPVLATGGSGGDIQHLVADELKRFNAVDKAWRDAMKQAAVDRSVMAVAAIERILERLLKCQHSLRTIRSGLSALFEAKRSAFPRFFFLSDEEILDLLSNTSRQPKGIEPFLRKCFDGVEKLDFSDDFDVVGMISAVGEELRLCERVDAGVHTASVEKWLAQLEKIMRSSIKREIRMAIDETQTQTQTETETETETERYWRAEWSAGRPQQAMAVATGVAVASQIENSLADTNALSRLLQKCGHRVERMAASSSSSSSSSESQLKTKFSLVSFVIYWSHTRDILQKLIGRVELDERIAIFSTQFRYSSQGDEIYARMVDSKIAYGYEYVANYSPAVRTPLTERCYRSFFLAVEYNYAACLQGPTGTGKTKMIENFAQLCGRQLKTLNCVVELDERLIERFFKGVAVCGSWICLDNADAACGQLRRTVDHALASRQRALLLAGAGGGCSPPAPADRLIFLTVSPTHYSHRRRLPPFSQNAVRRVSFERGEYEEMAPVRFAALAFAEADGLARKLNALLRICGALFEYRRFFSNDNRRIERLLASIERVRQDHRRWPEREVVRTGVTAVFESVLARREYNLFRRLLDKLLPPSSDKCDSSKVDADADADRWRSRETRRAIRQSAAAAGLDVDERLVEKTARFLQAIRTEADQGVVVCGPALAGKSSLVGLASETLKRLEVDCEVEVTVVNAKSISTRQLYGGRGDSAAEPWLDGVFTALWRLGCRHDDRHKCDWLLMDGPLDPTWMETLNSAMDDSRCLRLPTGESVPRGRNTRLIFETADLSHISPSTASRCFVVHVERNALDWRFLISRWLRHLPASVATHRRYVEEMALRFCRPLLHWLDGVRRAHRFKYAASDNHLIASMLGILDCFVDEFRRGTETRPEQTAEIERRSQLEGAFFFSCVWSLGGLLNAVDRRHMDVLFRALLDKSVADDVKNKYGLPDELCAPTSKTIVCSIPDCGTVFDYLYYVKDGKGRWKLWTEVEAAVSAAIPRDVRFDEIVVPTKEAIRNRHLIGLLVQNGKPVTLLGDTTSGKTTAITNFFETKLDRKAYEPVLLNFTATTCSDSIRRLIGCKLDKRKKGEYGPPLGIRYVIFIDDLNAASTDRCGANSAIELLRHCIEHRRWYAPQDALPTRLVDLQYVCASTTAPGRNDNLPCARFLRHFNVIGDDALDDQTLKSIFGKIMLWHLDTRGFGKEFDPCIDQIVDATLAIHRLVETRLLPVPSKTHYIFNLRDFSRIIRGVVTSVPEAVEDLAAMKRLWVHEVLRVYHDRIVDDRDSDWFLDALKRVTATRLKDDLNVLMRHLLADNETQINQNRLRKLIFCDFVNPKADVRNYAEVRDTDGLQSIVEGFLVEYNNVNKKPMNLLLFSYAIEHITRVCRILKQAQGHALLLGEYGCGKQSLARLAIHICEFEFFEMAFTGDYSQSDWRQDVKSLLFSVFADQHASLLLANIQIVADFVLEDIGSLLQTARIPGIFAAEEEKEICEKMEAIDSQRDKSTRTDGSRAALLDMFWRRVKKQIHVVLIYHSSTSEFGRYANKYPALVNHCAVDLFESWPAETQSVAARKLLANVECGYDDLAAVVELCQRIYSDAKAFCLDPNVDVRFTQKSFVRLVTTFGDILSKRCELLSTEKNSLDMAIKQLAKLDQDIPDLVREKKNLEPVVDGHLDTLRRLETQIETLREEETEAEIATNGAKTTANKMEKQLAARKSEYDERVERAKEAREMVVESLESLTANDTAVLKAMKNPPKPVKLVAEAIAYIKDLKADKGQEGGKVVEDFWKPAVKVICDSKFVDTLIAFDMDDVAVRTLRLLEERIFHHEEADAAKIRNYSAAAEVIFRWVRVVYDYGQLVKMDSDVRLRLDRASQQLAESQHTLQRERKRLEEIRVERRSRGAESEACRSRLEELRLEQATCDKKRQRAEQLVGALRAKSGRWIAKKTSVVEREKTLIGDSLLCAAILTFLTSLAEKIRDEKTNEWRSLVNSILSVNGEFCLAGALLDETQLEMERLNDEFVDPFFYDNLAIVERSSRYVLIDDAQSAMVDWLRRSLDSKGLITVRSDRQDWARSLENAVSSGYPVLLEHRDGEMDASLYPLVEKQSFKTAGGFAVRMGKNVVDFDPNFRLYVRTKLEAPRHSVETYEKLTVVNCATTKSGVKNSLFKLLLAKERPDSLAERNAWLAQLASARRTTDEATAKMVTGLALQPRILDDEAATNGVLSGALLCDDGESRICEARAQLRIVDAGLRGYVQAAEQLCSLFQLAGQLRELDSTYRFPLKWLENLTMAALDSIPNAESGEKRDVALSRIFLKMFHESVRRSLTEPDKLVFEFLLATHASVAGDEKRDAKLRLLFDRLRIDDEKGDATADANRASDSTCVESVSSQQPTDDQSEDDDDDDDDELKAAFDKMMDGVLARGEHVQRCVRDFVSERLKTAYSERTADDDLDSIYRSTNCCSAIVLVPMAAVSNPLLQVFHLAVEKGLTIEKCVLLSPSETIADASFSDAAHAAKSVGSWLILANVRFESKFLVELEMVLETLSPQTVHPDFRLWLILESHRCRPSTALTNSVTVPYTTSDAKIRRGMRKEVAGGGGGGEEYRGRRQDLGALTTSVEERVRESVAIFESGLRDWLSAFEWNEEHHVCDLVETRIAFDAICDCIRLADRFQNAAIGQLIDFLGDCCYGSKIAAEWDRRCLTAVIISFWTRPRLMLIFGDGENASRPLEWTLTQEIRERGVAKTNSQFVKRLLLIDRQRPTKRSTRPHSPTQLEAVVRLKESLPRPFFEQRLLQNGNGDGDDDDDEDEDEGQNIFIRHVVANEMRWFDRVVRQIESNLTNLTDSLSGRTYLDDRLEYLRTRLEEGNIGVLCLAEGGMRCERVFETNHALAMMKGKREFLEVVVDQWDDAGAGADDSDACTIKLIGVRLENASCQDDATRSLHPRPFPPSEHLPPVLVRWWARCDERLQTTRASRTQRYACPLFGVERYQRGDRRSAVLEALFPCRLTADRCLRAAICLLAAADSL